MLINSSVREMLHTFKHGLKLNTAWTANSHMLITNRALLLCSSRSSLAFIFSAKFNAAYTFFSCQLFSGRGQKAALFLRVLHIVVRVTV